MTQPAGAPAIDIQRTTPGHVRAQEGPYPQLRPVAGGRAWDAGPTHVRPAINEERLRATRAQARAVTLPNRQGMCG